MMSHDVAMLLCRSPVTSI